MESALATTTERNFAVASQSIAAVEPSVQDSGAISGKCSVQRRKQPPNYSRSMSICVKLWCISIAYVVQGEQDPTTMFLIGV